MESTSSRVDFPICTLMGVLRQGSLNSSHLTNLSYRAKCRTTTPRNVTYTEKAESLVFSDPYREVIIVHFGGTIKLKRGVDTISTYIAFMLEE